MQARVDHLVVLSADLVQGAAWCESTLGVAPGPGGEHALMGTHNRLLRVATVDYPRAYLEVIAPQPGRSPEAGRSRWFDLDEPRVLQQVRQHGPRLAHFVANVPDLAAALAAWSRLGIDRGEVVRASRMTPRGLLEWKIALRPDQRLFDGCLPTLIEWGDTHPAPGMPDSGVLLQAIGAAHPQAALLQAAYEAIGLEGVKVAPGEANLCAVLHTPRGRVKLQSGGL